MKKNIVSVLIAFIISITLLYLLLKDIDIRSFFPRVKTFSYQNILLITGGFFVLYVVRSLRFYMILKKNIIKIFMISIMHNFFNRILPFRMGELVWPLLLKKYLGVSIVHGIGVLLLVRYLDFLAIAVCFTAAALIIKPPFFTSQVLALMTAMIILQILSLIFLQQFIQLSINIVQKIKIGLLKNKVRKLTDRLLDLKSDLQNQNMFVLICTMALLSLCNWMALYIIFYAYVVMLATDFSLLHVIVASSAVAVITNLLPINSIGRFGTFELGWAAGYVLLGMPKETAIPLGLFVNVANTVLTGIMMAGAYCYLKTTATRREGAVPSVQ